MTNIILIILSIIGIIIGMYVLYTMSSEFLKEFEKHCHESIKKRDEEIEEKEKLNRDLRKWLSK